MDQRLEVLRGSADEGLGRCRVILVPIRGPSSSAPIWQPFTAHCFLNFHHKLLKFVKLVIETCTFGTKTVIYL